MTSPATYYPEFDSAEVEETIAPLSEFDDEIVGVLRGRRSMAEPSAISDGARHAVWEWLAKPEQYPFQSLIKNVAAANVDLDSLAPFEKLFHAPQTILTKVLERAEARVREVYTRPLVAAINHAREHERLVGDTPQQRYQYFVDTSIRTSFEEVSGLEFGVLRNVVRTVLDNVVAPVQELCRRLVEDAEAIVTTFGIDPQDAIVACGFSEGDSHHHGRSVSILEFHSGKKLVYKPRDVSCEAAYDTITRAFNDLLGTSLPAATVLERQGYGYVEFVEAQDVSDFSAEFMHSCGELAGVLYLLNARDMHFENIMPTRRGPVPIDLETILHPTRVHTGPTPEAAGNAYETIGQSIYGIGILPLVMVGKGADAGHVDLGFLGDQGRGLSPFKSMQFQEPYTDRVRLVLQAQATQERRTVVNTLTQDEVQLLGEQMEAGFTKVFRAAMAAKQDCTELLGKAVAGMRVRYVHNPTALYSQTLRMTSGANAAADLDAHVSLLKRIAIASKTSSRNIVRAEMRQLAERDIPYFTVASTGVELRDGDGVEIGAAFAESPLDRAKAKIDKMTEFELHEQLRLIRSAFSSRFPDNHLASADDLAAGTAAPIPWFDTRSEHTLVSLAANLANGMIATSVPDKFAHLPRTWIGPLASAQANRPWPPGVLGYDLYTGRVGPALALTAAARVLDSRACLDLAGQVFDPTADILSSHRYEMRSVRQAGFGGYTGLAGILFALATAGRLAQNEDWVGAAQDSLPLVLDQVRDQPVEELPLDVIGGLAGVALCVMAIGGPHAQDSVSALTTMLLAGLSTSDHQDLLAQSGFAHGVSGIVYALSRASWQLPVEQRDQVLAKLDELAERLHGFYDEDEGNWISNVATPRSFSTGWCHGATGIALALSAYGEVHGDRETLRRRDIAVANMIRYGFGRNLTWCHGDLGNHDVLASIAGDGPLRQDVRAVEHECLRPEVFARKVEDSRSRYAHTNSLMVGTAGIVLHLANRLDESVHVSPVTLTFASR